MKRSVSRIGCAAVCTALSLTLTCGCAVLPPASGVPGSADAPASSVPTDTDGKPLYDASRLDDGKLRALYAYDSAGNGTTILCGSRALHQAVSSENVSLVQDTITGETNYWFRTWSDPTGRGGRRSALYDKDGSEVLTFDGEQSATMQNGLLILQENTGINEAFPSGTCQVIDLATGENLPVPDGAYSCIVCGDALVFNCYARPANLAADAWDDDVNSHSWVTIQQKDGTLLRRVDATHALSLSYAPNVLSGWVELDTYAASGEQSAQTLYDPATGAELSGYRQLCGNGTASFLSTNGTYELRDLTTEGRDIIGTFADLPTQYFPGYVVTWSVDSDFGYSLHDLSTWDVTPLYDISATNDTLALYAQDGSLNVYNTVTGALLTDTNAGTVEDGQRVSLDCAENGFVWLELRDNDTYERTSVRVYGPEGLVSDLSALKDTYNYLGYLTTSKAGRPLYYGTRGATGSSYGTVCDVLDENGTIVMDSLGICYSFYSNDLNALPEHVFTAQRGFWYGWMDTDGNWLYCQNIFGSVDSEDTVSY